MSRAVESRKFGHFQRLSPPPFVTGAGTWPQILKLAYNTQSLPWADFLNIVLSYFLCHVILKLAVSRSRPPVPYGANFRSTAPSQPNKVGLKCPPARPLVRTSTKSFFDFNEIWYVIIGRRWWVMHDGMQYDPMQDQGQGHEPLKVGNSTIYKGYLLPIYNGGWQVTTDS